MSLYEPRCLVCGAPLGKGAPFEKSVRDSEVCSDRCYEIYMHNEDEANQLLRAHEALKEIKAFNNLKNDLDSYLYEMAELNGYLKLLHFIRLRYRK